MPVDIVRVRPDSRRPADVNALGGGVIVEAVVPRNLLPRLNAAG